LSYLFCRLTRLLILLHKPSQHVTRRVYSFVPIQDWTRRWADEDLYAKYGISADPAPWNALASKLSVVRVFETTGWVN